MVQWVRDLALLPQWLWLLLGYGFDPFHTPWMWPKKTKRGGGGLLRGLNDIMDKKQWHRALATWCPINAATVMITVPGPWQVPRRRSCWASHHRCR